MIVRGEEDGEEGGEGEEEEEGDGGAETAGLSIPYRHYNR